MASNLQLMVYEGHIGSEPELRYLPNGNPVCNFRMASNHEYTNRSTGEKVSQVTWLKCTVWGKLAEVVAKWTEKGSHVIISGRLNPAPDGNPAVFNRKDGTPGSAFEFVVAQIRIIKGVSGAPTDDQSEDLEFLND